jgi:hypothetical protein
VTRSLASTLGTTEVAGGAKGAGRGRTALRRVGVLGLRLDGDVEPRVREGWGEHYRRFL